MSLSLYFPENPYYLADIRLVLLGSAEEGKRSVGNTILGREEFSSQKTALCVTKIGAVVGRQVTVINTPGWGREATANFRQGVFGRVRAYVCIGVV